MSLQNLISKKNLFLPTLSKPFHLIFFVSLGFNFLFSPSLFAQTNGICKSDLDNAIAKVINRPEYLKAHWGIVVKEIDNEEIIYNLNGEKFLIPASNVKLLTTAAVLLKFGENYRFQTPIFLTENSNNSHNLTLIGQGDPSLTSEDLETVAQKLNQENIREINQLIILEQKAQNTGIHSTWEWGDIYYYYGVNVNSLILNQNTVNLTITPQKLGEKVALNWSDPLAGNQYQVINTALTAPENTPYNLKINGILGKPTLEITGELAINSGTDLWSLAILDPSQYFLDSFANILEQNNIKVKGKFNSNPILEVQENTQLLMSMDSDNLGDLVFKTNQESNNLYAQALFNLLGNQLNNQNNLVLDPTNILYGVNPDNYNRYDLKDISEETRQSLEVLTEILSELGLNSNSYNLRDGSGLSRHNFVTPFAFVQILELMIKTPLAQVYQNSLPIAGVSGTLKNRFKDTVLMNNLRAKTGTATGISALSGYLTSQEGKKLVFSIILNNSEQNTPILRKGIDEITLMFYQLKDCST